jgi:hypothetical protein
MSEFNEALIATRQALHHRIHKRALPVTCKKCGHKNQAPELA